MISIKTYKTTPHGSAVCGLDAGCTEEVKVMAAQVPILHIGQKLNSLLAGRGKR